MYFAPQDLAGRSFRELVHEPEAPRVLVSGDPLLRERDELRRGRAGTRLERDSGANLFPELRMGQPDHGDLRDGRMLVQDFLDLTRVHVVTAPDDEVLLAVDNVVVAVLVYPRHVSSAEPAVFDRLRGGIGLPPVALHHVVAADGDLADLALRNRLPFVVDEPHLHALDRRADRARLTDPIRVVERRNRRSFRQPVALEDDAAELLLEAAQDLHGQRGTT